MYADRQRPGRIVRLGILGGTFDPVHLGHVQSAREIAAAHDLDSVLFVLSARPPHKPGGDAAPIADRWEMLKLATGASTAAGTPRLEPCDVEIRRDGPSWTVDTLRALQAMHPGTELVLILGADAYAEIDTWSRPGELLELASIIVTSRPGWHPHAEAAASEGSTSVTPPEDAHDCEHVPIPPVAARADARYDPVIGVHVHTSGHTLRGHRIRGIEVSSSEIRQRVRAGLPIEHLTGHTIARYISEHRLYGSDRAPAPAAAPPTKTQGAEQD